MAFRARRKDNVSSLFNQEVMPSVIFTLKSVVAEAKKNQQLIHYERKKGGGDYFAEFQNFQGFLTGRSHPRRASRRWRSGHRRLRGVRCFSSSGYHLSRLGACRRKHCSERSSEL